MAYAATKKVSEAMKVRDIMMATTGYAPSVLRDGGVYRIQEDAIGSDALRTLLAQHKLGHLYIGG